MLYVWIDVIRLKQVHVHVFIYVIKHNMYQLRVMVYLKQQKHVTLTVLHVSRGKTYD